MSRTFTCCELIQRIKDFQTRSIRWPEEEKYKGIDFLQKASSKLINTKKRWNEEFKENNYESTWDFLFCEECEKWFSEQNQKYGELINAKFEKEEAEGTFYSHPSSQKALQGFKEKAEKLQKDLETKSEPKNNSPPFWKKPTGIILLISGLVMLVGISFWAGYYFAKKHKIKK